MAIRGGVAWTSPAAGPADALDPGAALPAPERRAEPHLLLLRSFDLVCAGASVLLPSGAQRVLAFLGLQDRPVERAHVAASLWQDSTDRRAGGSLRSALWRLKATGLDLVHAMGTRLRLSPGLSVDYHRGKAAARRALDSSPTGPVCLQDLAYLRDDLLGGWYDDWVLVEREQFRQVRLHALEALGERFIAEGRHAEAVDAGLSAVLGEPLRESAQRVLIRAYLAEANRQEAVRQFRAYERLLREELDVAPSEDLGSLISFVPRLR